MPIATVSPATGEVLKAFDPLSDAVLDARLGVEAFSSYRRNVVSQASTGTTPRG